MSDTKPKRKRGTKPGSIRTLRVRLWWAVQEAADLLDDPDVEVKLRAIHALSTAGGAYGRLTELHKQEAEIAELRKELDELKQELSRPPSRPSGSSAAQVN